MEKTGNARFVFANFTFSKGNFLLIHSDCLGENRNPDWKKSIYRNPGRTPQNSRGWGTGGSVEWINE